MPNTHRYGLRFLKNRWGGETPEPEVLRIASTYAPSNGAVTCNLNIGDVIYKDDSGNAVLLAPGSTTTADDQVTQRAYGVVVGFPQILIGGAVRPNSFYPTGTAYTNYDQRTLVKVIPVESAVWEIDTNAAGGGSRDSRAEFENVVGGAAHIVYSALGTGTANVKANPLFDIANITQAVAAFRQLRVLGVGRLSDNIDFETTNVPLQVVFNLVQTSPWRLTAGFDGA